MKDKEMNSVKADTTNELFKAEIAGSERLRSLILIGILGLEALLLMIIYFFYHTQYLLLFNTTIAIFAILIFTVLIILYEILIHYLIKKKVRVFFQHRNILGYINAFSEITLLTGLFIFIVEYSNQTIILQAPATLTYELNTLAGRERKTEEEFAGSNTFPNRGMHLNTRAGYYAGLNEETDHFLKLSGDWVTYLSYSQRPRVVYALRVGGQKLFGDYAFHEAATLGRTENLRGYRETRFYGDASLYLNAEVRIRMKQFQTYLLNGTAGALLFNDTGRVWFGGENSKKWHNGTGLGLWFSPFDMAVVSVSYAASPDDRLFNFSVNYQF